MALTIWIILGLIVLVGLWLLVTYNGLVTLRNRVREAWSEIDVQLKRHSSLIPNLVETVKGYAKHEKEVFENVNKARSALMGAQSLGEKAAANDMLSGALKSLFAVAEAYPNLRASENFKELQEELSDTETKVAAARQFYNTNVLDLNTTLETFPTVLIGNMFGFKKEEFFKAMIAEGYARREALKDFQRYLRDAVGESNEMINHILLAKVKKYIKKRLC